MLNIPHGAYHLLTDDIRRQREMANSDIAPHAGIWKTMMHNKHSSFLVKLTIHDITNVPLVSGSFSVRWKFRGSKGDLDLARESTFCFRSYAALHPCDEPDGSPSCVLSDRNGTDDIHPIQRVHLASRSFVYRSVDREEREGRSPPASAGPILFIDRLFSLIARVLHLPFPLIHGDFDPCHGTGIHVIVTERSGT
jgi:hypothetical protein